MNCKQFFCKLGTNLSVNQKLIYLLLDNSRLTITLPQTNIKKKCEVVKLNQQVEPTIG